MWAARKRFLLGFVPRDRAEENKTSCPEREEKRNKKKKNQTQYPEIKSLSLPSRSHDRCAVSPPLPGESRNKCRSSEPRNFCNLPPPGERYLYAAGGGRLCFAIPALSAEYFGEDETAVENPGCAADLSRRPEDPSRRGVFGTCLKITGELRVGCSQPYVTHHKYPQVGPGPALYTRCTRRCVSGKKWLGSWADVWGWAWSNAPESLGWEWDPTWPRPRPPPPPHRVPGCAAAGRGVITAARG